MSALRGLVSFGFLVSLMVFVGVWLANESRLHAQDGSSTSLVGAWTLDKNLSESSNPSDGRTDDGFGRGGAGGGRPDPEDMVRQRAALRDIMTPPDHLTIVQSNNLIVITGPDGRTTRLAPDGKKVTDESTKVERKTKWDGGKLVTEISGIGSTRVTETYSVDPEHHHLRLVVHSENSRRPSTTTYVYDADSPAQ